MPSQHLRRTCRARLNALDLPQPFSLDAFCGQLSRVRGRGIHLHTMPLHADPHMPCGVWIATANADHIFHSPGVSPIHQENIILHEIGHMLCDHRVDDADVDLGALFADLDPRMIRSVLMRTRYTSWQEVEAEMMAALILGEACRPLSRTRPDGALGSLHDIFGLSRR